MHSEYRARLNRVNKYIDEHIGDSLDLETLAEVAAFSKYHFHRVFTSLMGEPLGTYIQRLRLEKAAAQVADRTDYPITNIAYDLGFSSPAVLSRAFKEHFGMSPRDWRAGGWQDHGKNRKLQSNRYESIHKYREATKVSNGYGNYIKRQWRVTMKTEQKELDYTVEVKEIPKKTVAYVCHTGPLCSSYLLCTYGADR